jgi:hypothetical protein
MKRQNDKQEIAQLLSKFMAGETSVAEEQMLAQYFRTHEVGEDWVEYKEMFALFDSGEVDIELEVFDTSGRLLWKKSETGIPTDHTYTIDWDLTTGNGSRLKTGVYLYRVLISNNGSSKASQAKKLIILGQ